MTIEPTVMWARVKGSVSPGNSSLTLDRDGGLLDILPYSRILVGVGTDRWEWKAIGPVNVNNQNITGLNAFAHSYSDGELVAVCTIGTHVPFSWIGGLHDNTLSVAASNVTQANRFVSFNGFRDGSILNRQNDQAVLALDGAYYVNDIVRVAGGISHLTGLSRNCRRDGLIAHSSFPFNSSYTKNLVGGENEYGFVNTYADPHYDIASYISHIFFDGQGMANSIGYVTTPQQPGFAHSLLFRGFRGPAAFSIGGPAAAQNCYDPVHIFGEDNYCTLASFQIIYSVRDLQIRNPAIVNGISQPIYLSGECGSLVGVKIYGMSSPGPAIILTGTGSHSIVNCSVEGFSTSPGVIVQEDSLGNDERNGTYSIRNLSYRSINPNVKVLRDIQRNISLKDANLYGRCLNAHPINEGQVLYGNNQFAQSGSPNAA